MEFTYYDSESHEFLSKSINEQDEIPLFCEFRDKINKDYDEKSSELLSYLSRRLSRHDEWFFHNMDGLILNVQDFNIENCQSPIEVYFFIAISCLMSYIVGNSDNIFKFISLENQRKIKTKNHRYFADFSISYLCPKFKSDGYKRTVIEQFIETDGYDYHSTKSQITKDIERENEIKSSGIDVVRFTGRQVYHNPIKCAITALDIFSNKLKNITDEFTHQDYEDMWECVGVLKVLFNEEWENEN